MKQFADKLFKTEESKMINGYVLNILEKIMDHGPVYVHCFAGIERSPLICMAWLIKKHKMEVNESLRYMMSIHKKTNPLPFQIDCLHKFKKILSK